VIYLDTSIKFKSSQIEHIIERVKDVGMLSRYIELTLPCFTDTRMFDWFGESASAYRRVHSLEANFLIFSRTFVTSLLMKAWVSCSLDRNCIAPPGAHIYGNGLSVIRGCARSCECHRFDQDALTIVNSYFYGYPLQYRHKPAFSFTERDEYFYDLIRRNVLVYIKEQIYAFALIFVSFIF
jgi:hypothetical protein